MRLASDDPVGEFQCLLALSTVPMCRLGLERPSNVRWLLRHVSPLNCPQALISRMMRLLAELQGGPCRCVI